MVQGRNLWVKGTNKSTYMHLLDPRKKELEVWRGGLEKT